MNFLADESVDKEIVIKLRKDGFPVKYIAEISPGISDEIVLNHANKENAILITADKDFGELVFRQNRVTYGVILVRLHGLLQNEKAIIVSQVITKHKTELSNCFSVISKDAIRIRHLF